MKLIVGLGNPGAKYRYTRHNAGKMLIEYAAEKLSQKWEKKNALQASITRVSWEGEQLVFAYPETYMNASGEAVKKLSHHFEIIASKDLLVAVDDIALPFGRLRMRAKGSDGGHNGLKSVQKLIGSQGFARLRIGVGNPQGGEGMDVPSLEKYVLDEWTREERRDLPLTLDRGFEAIRIWVSRGIDAAMNAVNPSEI